MTRPPAGVILAAGSSRRMHVPKQVLPFSGSTILGATVGVVESSALENIVLVLGANSAAVMSVLHPRRTRVVYNPNPHSGALSSLVVGAGAAGYGPLILLMGDMPGVDGSVIDKHIAAASKAPIVTTTYSNGVAHPFTLSAGTVGALHLLEGSRPLWRLAQSKDAGTIHVDVPRPIDIDTPDDYAASNGSL